MAAQPAFDPVRFKNMTREQWDQVADRWNAWGWLIQEWLGPATEIMLDMARIGPESRVLHVAAGSGQEAIQTARRIGSDGYILATDFSENLVRLIRQNAEAAGLRNVDSQLMDGEELEVPHGSFDGVTSRVGLMFFPDQQKSVERMKAALKPGGWVAAIVFATPEENRFFSEPVGIIRRRAGLPPPLPAQPGPFSLGAPGRIESLFEAAGLINVHSRKAPAPLRMRSAAECLRFEQESFGALHQMLSGLDQAGRNAAWEEVGSALREFETDDGFAGPCLLVVAAGQKP
jgi:SAM-dependent methyltransferase